ncbi:M56 family metallopeptidase [Kitasatospora sp. RB6PN24]|uniref:M56 family metallopeptidase n=1 Tax=Kitasatospora humi TaxID=2893891 RepID=UPI001E56F707|nr:M56 family metallopeptidase [Kitasatospora humi]MCC9311001.1 M56 family metallopeptidase [Kitasatospora humi]
MPLSVAVPLAVCVLLAVTAPRLSRALVPRVAAWMLTCAAAVGAALWTGALALLAFAGLGRVRAVAALGPWSVSFLHTQDPVSTPLACAAGTVLAGCLAWAAVTAYRRGRVLTAAYRKAARLPDDRELIVVDAPRIEAFALPGRPGRVVVSTGMLRSLEPAEWEAVLAHEQAHLRHHHHAFLHVLHLAAVLCPLMLPLAREGEYAVERWADEEAAEAVGDRTLLARALARAALAGQPAHPAPAATGGPVPRRVRALLSRPPARRRTGSLLVVTLLLLLGLAGLGQATADTRALYEQALHTYAVRHCGGHPCR